MWLFFIQNSSFYCSWGFAVYTVKIAMACELHFQDPRLHSIQDGEVKICSSHFVNIDWCGWLWTERPYVQCWLMVESCSLEKVENPLTLDLGVT